MATMRTVPRFAVLALAVALPAGAAGCKRPRHARLASFTPPPPRAGFVERSGGGWRVSVPSTWRDAAAGDAGAWAVVDPQAADDFHAKVFVVTEPFAGESYDYARASEAGVRREKRASVEAPREDVVDGDPTLILETHWAPSPPGSVPYRTMQTALASRGTGYVVTCAVSVGAFESYRSTCESILRSFAVER
jgi:hypothetical protein